MWLIEFVEGHLHGVTLPIEPKLVITGSKEGIDLETLYVPEALPTSVRWELFNDGNGIAIRGLKKGDKLKTLRRF